MRFNIEFDIDMWLVVPAEDGPYSSQGEAQLECNSRNKSLGWTGSWVGEEEEPEGEAA
ncbi:MAG TPA: hypothetical protein VKW06_00270 [Candidatus Angelobacter sp.]|nr:hypothetical protein [Candidatus Angelobacter sp.]